jgi:hypothetical protein
MHFQPSQYRSGSIAFLYAFFLFVIIGTVSRFCYLSRDAFMGFQKRHRSCAPPSEVWPRQILLAALSQVSEVTTTGSHIDCGRSAALLLPLLEPEAARRKVGKSERYTMSGTTLVGRLSST